MDGIWVVYIYIYSKPSQILGYGKWGESYIDDNDNVPFLLLQVWKPAPNFHTQTAPPIPPNSHSIPPPGVVSFGRQNGPQPTRPIAAAHLAPVAASIHQDQLHDEHPSMLLWPSVDHQLISPAKTCVAMETKKIVKLKQSEQFIPKLPDSNATL
jgi:hypothetical protein